MTLQVENGSMAIFKCRHNSANTIGWSVNGSSVRQSHGITQNIINNTLYILTIPAMLEYNGTVVMCQAFFGDGSPTEVTTPAILTVITGF